MNVQFRIMKAPYFTTTKHCMRTLVTLLFLISIVHSAMAQEDTVFIRHNKNQFGGEKIEYTTDTIVFETPLARSILYGTTIMPWTANQQYAKGYGLYLKEVSIAPCQQGERPPDMEEVLGISQTDTSMIVELNIIGNCCHAFLCDIQVVNDSVIDLIHYGYGATYCACYCCFGLTYEFSLLREYSEFDKLKYVMINGDERTLKRL